MPRNKNKKEAPPPHPIETASPEEQQKMMMEMLVFVQKHMDAENACRLELFEFHQKCGKTSTAQMNAKERKEIEKIMKKHSPILEAGRIKMDTLVGDMKGWRTNAGNFSKESGQVNAIELLNLRHGCLPIWDPEKKELPHGVGAIAWPDNKKLESGDEVAAFVEESKTWILAEVLGSVSNHRYECVDIDDQDKKVTIFARKQLIPMPQFTAHYCKYPNLTLPKNAIVLALYPNTTCFYEGIVFEPPKRASEKYLIRFIDNAKPDNYSDPMPVSDRYVVVFKKDPVMYIRPAKRIELGLEQPKEIAYEKLEEKKKPKQKKGEKQVVVVDDKNTPGPAPKATAIHESRDETVKAKQRKPRTKSAEPKIKIIRAKVPPHKKNVSTRQFGKRRVKRKPKNADREAGTVIIGEQSQIGPANVEKKDEAMEREQEELSSSNENLTGLAKYGLEDEREETDSEEEEEESESENEEEKNRGEEDNDQEKNNEDDGEKEDKVEEKNEDEKMEVEEEKDDDIVKRVESVKLVEPYNPHDPQEGTSGPTRYPSESESDSEDEMNKRRRSSSDSSDAQSGLSISDHEGRRRDPNSDNEPEL